MFNLLYITNRPEVAVIAEKYGVNRIWIDLETKGKKERQGEGTWISDHTIFDITKVKSALSTADVLVRVNPWNEESKEEIDAVIDAGADIIMIPMWKTAKEVENFLTAVNKRKRIILLLETKEAEDCLDEVISLKPEEIHIGLRDLSLAYGLPTIFHLYENGVVEKLTVKMKNNSVKFGIGGIGKFGIGLRPGPECILTEDVRLGASSVILARTFQRSDIPSLEEIELGFKSGVSELLKWHQYALDMPKEVLEYNHNLLIDELKKSR